MANGDENKLNVRPASDQEELAIQAAEQQAALQGQVSQEQPNTFVNGLTNEASFGLIDNPETPDLGNSLGHMTGALLPPLGAGALAGLAFGGPIGLGVGALVGGAQAYARAVDHQMDQGKTWEQVNQAPAIGSGLLNTAINFVPPLRGASALKSVLINGGLQGTLNAGGDLVDQALNQYADTQTVDPTKLDYGSAAISGAAGAGLGAAHSMTEGLINYLNRPASPPDVNPDLAHHLDTTVDQKINALNPNYIPPLGVNAPSSLFDLHKLLQEYASERAYFGSDAPHLTELKNKIMNYGVNPDAGADFWLDNYNTQAHQDFLKNYNPGAVDQTYQAAKQAERGIVNNQLQNQNNANKMTLRGSVEYVDQGGTSVPTPEADAAAVSNTLFDRTHQIQGPEQSGVGVNQAVSQAVNNPDMGMDMGATEEWLQAHTDQQRLLQQYLAQQQARNATVDTNVATPNADNARQIQAQQLQNRSQQIGGVADEVLAEQNLARLNAIDAVTGGKHGPVALANFLSKVKNHDPAALHVWQDAMANGMSPEDIATYLLREDVGYNGAVDLPTGQYDPNTGQRLPNGQRPAK